MQPSMYVKTCIKNAIIKKGAHSLKVLLSHDPQLLKCVRTSAPYVILGIESFKPIQVVILQELLIHRENFNL